MYFIHVEGKDDSLTSRREIIVFSMSTPAIWYQIQIFTTNLLKLFAKESVALS